MTTISTFIKRYPLLSYFVLVFAISWGGTLIAAGPDGFQSGREFGFSYVAMLAGPCVAGIVLTGLLYGRTGLSELLSRLLKWRVDVRWYAVAILTAPLLFMAVLLGLSLASPEFIPRIFTDKDKVFLL